MSKRLLGRDPFTGVSTFHHYDPMTDQTHIESVQDVAPLIDKNKALHNTSHQKDGIKRSWMHAASIPVIVQEQWRIKYGIDVYNKDHMPRIKKLLNDPEYRYLKTGTCKL